MSGCCGHDAKFDGVSNDYKRRLWIVIAINAQMFIVEMSAGRVAQSQALQADALDFLGDALIYGISLAVIGASVRIRTNAALAKGFSLLLMGAWVFGSTVYRIYGAQVPDAQVMGAIGALALAANVVCTNTLTGWPTAKPLSAASSARNVNGSAWSRSVRDAPMNSRFKRSPPTAIDQTALMKVF